MSKINFVLTIDTEDKYGNTPDLIECDFKNDGNCGVLYLMEQLEKRNMRAVFFVNIYEHLNYHGIYEDYIENLCKQIDLRGHEVGLHSHADGCRLQFYKKQLDECNYEETKLILKYGVDFIKKTINKDVYSFRGGDCKINDYTFGCLSELGIHIDSSYWHTSPFQSNNLREYYSLNKVCYVNSEVIEFPIVNVIGRDGLIKKFDFNQISLDDFINIISNIEKRLIDDNEQDIYIQMMMHSFSLIDQNSKNRKLLYKKGSHSVYGVNEILKKKLESMLDFLHQKSTVNVTTFSDLILNHDLKNKVKTLNPSDSICFCNTLASYLSLYNFKTTNLPFDIERKKSVNGDVYVKPRLKTNIKCLHDVKFIQKFNKFTYTDNNVNGSLDALCLKDSLVDYCYQYRYSNNKFVYDLILSTIEYAENNYANFKESAHNISILIKNLEGFLFVYDLFVEYYIWSKLRLIETLIDKSISDLIVLIKKEEKYKDDVFRLMSYCIFVDPKFYHLYERQKYNLLSSCKYSSEILLNESRYKNNETIKNWGLSNLDKIVMFPPKIYVKDVISASELLLQGKLKVFESEIEIDCDVDDINWNNTKLTSTFNLYLQSLTPLGYLVQAFVKRKKIDYLKIGYKFFKSWLAYVNSAHVKNKYTWSSHSSALRTDNIINFLVNSSSLNLKKEQVFEILDCLFEHGIYLSESKNYEKGHNHGLMQDFSLLQLSMIFPNKQWLKLAQHRIFEQISLTFNSELLHTENSPSYSRMITTMLSRLKNWFIANKVDSNIDIEKYITQLNIFNRYCLKPNGYICNVGDSACTFYDDNIIKLKKNCLFRVTGYYFYNSSLPIGKMNTWKCFKCGYQNLTHKHCDDNSFLLYSKGNDIFIDGGIYAYKYDRYRTYFLSNKAHNSIVIDDETYDLKIENKKNCFISDYVENKNYCFIEGENNSYDNALWKRKFFTANDLTFICDEVQLKDKSRAVSQIFHLAPQISICSFNKNKVILQIPNTEFYVVIKQYGEIDSADDILGDKLKPGYGLYSLSNNHLDITHTIKFTKKGLSVNFITVIYIVNSAGEINLEGNEIISNSLFEQIEFTSSRNIFDFFEHLEFFINETFINYKQELFNKFNLQCNIFTPNDIIKMFNATSYNKINVHATQFDFYIESNLQQNDNPAYLQIGTYEVTKVALDNYFCLSCISSGNLSIRLAINCFDKSNILIKTSSSNVYSTNCNNLILLPKNAFNIRVYFRISNPGLSKVKFVSFSLHKELPVVIDNYV